MSKLWGHGDQNNRQQTLTAEAEEKKSLIKDSHGSPTDVVDLWVTRLSESGGHKAHPVIYQLSGVLRNRGLYHIVYKRRIEHDNESQLDT